MKLLDLLKEGTGNRDVLLKVYNTGKFKGKAVAFFLSDKAQEFAERVYTTDVTDAKGNPMLGFHQKNLEKFKSQMKKSNFSIDELRIESVIKEAYTPEYETHTALHKDDIPSVSKYKKTGNGIVYQKGHRVVGPDGVGEIIKQISDDIYLIGIYKDGTATVTKKIKAPMWVSESVVTEADKKVNSKSKTFLKGMKKINVKSFADKWMPGNTYLWYDGKTKKFWFVDSEGDYMELKNETTLKELYKFLKSKNIKTEAVDKNEPEVIT